MIGASSSPFSMSLWARAVGWFKKLLLVTDLTFLTNYFSSPSLRKLCVCLNRAWRLYCLLVDQVTRFVFLCFIYRLLCFANVFNRPFRVFFYLLIGGIYSKEPLQVLLHLYLYLAFYLVCYTNTFIVR